MSGKKLTEQYVRYSEGVQPGVLGVSVDFAACFRRPLKSTFSLYDDPFTKNP